MRLGIPREVKPFENRVAMTPQGTRRLIEAGFEVWIESGAGVRSGFPDADYRRAKAKILSNAKDVWRSDLVLKVKEPQPSEFRFFRPDLVLMTFLHLAAEPRLTRALLKSKVTAIGYETIESSAPPSSPRLPILAPMSEIAGSLASLIGANFLRRDLGGKGLLLGAVGRGGTGHVTVLGAGHVGSKAVEVAHGLGASVTVFDIDAARLAALGARYPERLQTLADPAELPEVIRRTDLLIGAVLVPGRKAPKIVSAKLVRTMEPGSAVFDVAIDQGGCIETSRVTTIRNPYFLKYGVLHCGITNLPSLVPKTATEALSAETLPYLLKIASLGWNGALRDDPGLSKGVNVKDGRMVTDRPDPAFPDNQITKPRSRDIPQIWNPK